MRTFLLFAALLTACGTTAPEPEGDDTVDTWRAPSEAGPWSSAVTEGSTTGRTGVELPLWIWYPTDKPAPIRVEYAGVLDGDATIDGVPACDAPRPVVLFSHGNSGLAYQSFFLTEHLAARGYIVVAPNHTGNTLHDLGDVSRDEMAIRRPHDIADSFDRLLERNATPGDLLEGCIDPDAGYAVMGHSFGGYTTLAVAGAPLNLEQIRTDCIDTGFDMCGAAEVWDAAFPSDSSGDLSDPRVWAAVPLAPAAMSALSGTLEQITVPTMVIASMEDAGTLFSLDGEPLYDELTATPRYLAGLSPAGHYTYTDFCLVPSDGCDPERFLPLDEAHALINTLASAFLASVQGEARASVDLHGEHDGIGMWKTAP